MHVRRYVCGIALPILTLMAYCHRAHSQITKLEKVKNQSPLGTPLSWVQAASDNELKIVGDDGTFPVRYLVRKIDAKGETLRDTVESRDGSVARLIGRDGRPLTSQEDADERERLNGLIASPSLFARHHKRNSSARQYSSDLIRLMPSAMVFTYAVGQPQPPGVTSTQIVIDFQPDPKFEPPSMIAQLLTGIEGRLWIDARTRVVTRAEARVVRGVNFGWGMLAHIYPGGTIEFEQSPVGEGHWIYSHVDEHLKIREVMVKTANEDTTMSASNIRMMPEMLSYQDAIRKLLDTPLPAR